ncbi:unnamed protein product, partial [Penicillium egyptiacum]
LGPLKRQVAPSLGVEVATEQSGTGVGTASSGMLQHLDEGCRQREGVERLVSKRVLLTHREYLLGSIIELCVQEARLP